MTPNDRPEAYGVFKPVGHVIVALPTEADARGAMNALIGDGFAPTDIVSYTPEQMRRQADIDIEQAGVLAGIGQELNLVKAHRELAIKGNSFPRRSRAAGRSGTACRSHRPAVPCDARAELRPLGDRGADQRGFGPAPGRRIPRPRAGRADTLGQRSG